jgi:hypothetical protein
MAKISKYIKLDKNILLEYIYNEGNLLSEPYNILVDSRDRRQSYMAAGDSATGNGVGNQLFKVDSVSGKYAKVNPDYYSFLQVKDYTSGTPVRHDTLKFHLPINWTFGEYLGFYVRIYGFDTSNTRIYDLCNFYFDMTDISQQYLLNFTSPPLLFQEKLWGKNVQIDIPALNDLSSQRVNNSPKENSINANLTGGVGLNMTSPVFIDFHFVKNIQTINAVTSYLLTPKVTSTIPQTPEFERLGLVIQHSPNGDFFEIFGTYNNTISGFNQFIDESYNIGHRYYVQYNVTMYEQNIRGKTTTVTQHENFNETVEYRPIIKYSTTTAIIDVEMRLIDAVDDSYILRRASYGMLQDEVAKYSLRMMKINLVNASKPKIYNIKASIDPSLVGFSNSMGRITKPVSQSKAVSGIIAGGGNGSNGNGTGNGTGNGSGSSNVTIQTVKVPFPVLTEKFNIIGKSDNAIVNKTTFFGLGKITIVIYPFDNVIKFVLADGTPTTPNYLNMTGLGEIRLVFKNTTDIVEIPLYSETEINLEIGQIAFKITESKISTLRKIENSGINIFYITATNQGLSTAIYTGLYKLYDSINNASQLNSEAPSSSSNPSIIKDPNLPSETAIVTRRKIGTESKPVVKPGSISSSVKNTISAAINKNNNL